MNYLKIAIGVLVALSASRFIPHPPNFTSLLALSFYIPAIFGIKFIPILILALSFTDLILGFHSTILFTWGSVIIIGLISKYFNKSILFRISGALTGAIIFFILTNFGVWLGGSYGYDIDGFLKCYILAIPFFAHSAISTFIFSALIETLLKFKFLKFLPKFTK
tara:strand:- start:965 stop:1456 length:492 start_codon:yes stop_codon:yes gene_type:complete